MKNRITHIRIYTCIRDTCSRTNRPCNNSASQDASTRNTESRLSKAPRFDDGSAVLMSRQFNWNFNFRSPGSFADRVECSVWYLRFDQVKYRVALSRAHKFIMRENALPPDSGWSSKQRTARKSSFCDFMVATSRWSMVSINRNSESCISN